MNLMGTVQTNTIVDERDEGTETNKLEEFLKEEGCLEEFKRNIDILTPKSPARFLKFHRNLEGAIGSAFIWSKTEEGQYYWSRIEGKWKNYLRGNYKKESNSMHPIEKNLRENVEKTLESEDIHSVYLSDCNIDEFIKEGVIGDRMKLEINISIGYKNGSTNVISFNIHNDMAPEFCACTFLKDIYFGVSKRMDYETLGDILNHILEAVEDTFETINEEFDNDEVSTGPACSILMIGDKANTTFGTIMSRIRRWELVHKGTNPKTENTVVLFKKELC